jgi:hypothetical protein
MTTVATTQQFHKGDLVRVVKDLGPTMPHFASGVDGIVIGSYADQYGRRVDSFTVYIQGQGETSWYRGEHLVLVERNRMDKLLEWKEAAASERKLRSDLDWIFSHGKEALARAHGATVKALAESMGITEDLSGSQREGFVYYQNAMTVMRLAEPFLRLGDKEGWLRYVTETSAFGPTLPTSTRLLRDYFPRHRRVSHAPPSGTIANEHGESSQTAFNNGFTEGQRRNHEHRNLLRGRSPE